MNTVAPEQVGFSTTRLKRIGKTMQSHVDEGRLAGLITMVARRGQVVHFECFGMMDREANKAMKSDTIFRIHSMTKPITSVAVMMLYEEGRFRLNAPVSEFIPGFKDVKVFVNASEAGLELTEPEREITIRDLLTHTSGLVYGDPEGSPVETLVWQANQEARKAKPDETLEEWVQRLVGLPLAHQPGTKWHYGVSTDVLGYIVEVISGTTFGAFLEQRIFAPLGMENTGFYLPQEKIGRLAAVYGPAEGGGLQVIEPPAIRDHSKPPSFFSGGGGLVSTAPDYYRFAQMLLNGGELDGVRLLGRKTVEFMTLNHLPEALIPMQMGTETARGMGFGLGFAVITNPAHWGELTSVGSYFWAGAASTFFWVDPEEELTGLILIQLMPAGDHPVAGAFRMLVYQAIVD